MKIACVIVMMWWKWHFISVVFLPKTSNLFLIMRKASDKSKLRAFYKILDECFLNHQNQENPKTARAKNSLRHDNYMLCSILGQKRMLSKTYGNTNKVLFNISVLFISYDKCTILIQDINNVERGYGIYGNSVPSSQFFCKFKTIFK